MITHSFDARAQRDEEGSVHMRVEDGPAAGIESGR